MADRIQTETDGRVFRITINRPDEGNRMTNEMADQLADAIDGAGGSAQIVVLRGAGADFCLGRDAGGPPANLPEALDLRDENETVFNCYGAFRRSPVPVVGAVQGRALGFGCALAALCDITIAGAGARFALPEMGHNIMPTMAMSSLVDRLGRKGAMYLVYSTEEVEAETALAYGLVSRVVADADLDAALDRLLAAMLKAPMTATRAVKEYARHAFTTDIGAAIDFARNLHATVNSSSRLRG